MLNSQDIRTVDFTNHICKICSQKCQNRRSIGNHLVRSHKITIKDYILKFYLDNKVPLCKCGCNNNVQWHDSQYKFNDYITGHNNQETRFSKTNQPIFTQEQLDYRNKRVQENFKEKREEITKKLSDASKNNWLKEEYRKKVSDGHKKSWAKYSKEQISEMKKSVWKKHYNNNIKKIFTEEFCKNISIRNSKRKIIGVSKEQIEFGLVLENIFGEDLIKNHSFQNEDRNLSFDFFLKDNNLAIEYDGSYWHGLDRKENFSIDQMINLKNDFIKNKICLKNKISLLRINSIDFLKQKNNIKSYEDLFNISYHVQKEDKIIKDGTIKLNDHDKFLTKSTLIKYKINYGEKIFENKVLKNLFNFLRQYVEWNGWFYPQESNSLIKTMNIIKNYKVDLSSNEISSTINVGNDYLKSLFTSFWDVNNGPVQSFFDDIKLNRILKYRIGLNNSKKYKYKINNKIVETNETFDITLSNIRKGFIVSNNSVSWFKPIVAYQIYKKYLNNTKNPVVYDPSCGFGARLLGFATAFPEGQYIGCEPASKTYNNLIKLSNNLSNTKVNIYKCGSEILDFSCISDNIKFDLIFTSPPYFNLEKYFNEDEQCWKKYPTIDLWKTQFLDKTIKNCVKNLKDDGYVIFNINNNLKDLFIQVCCDNNLKLKEELKLNIGNNHFSRKNGNKNNKFEPILVFTKTDK